MVYSKSSNRVSKNSKLLRQLLGGEGRVETATVYHAKLGVWRHSQTATPDSIRPNLTPP